jgi:hypothetical protein
MQLASARYAGRGLLLAVVLLLCGLTAPAFAQDPVVTVEPDGERFDPALSEEMRGTEADEPTSETPIDPAEATTPDDEEDTVSDETIQQPGWGNAADQAPAAKRSEAATDCQGNPPPTSKMLGLPGSVGGSEGGSLGWLVLVIAAGALLVAGIAYGLRRRRYERGSLETVATVVGILGAIAGIAVQFVPGVGVHQPPAAEASMEVRDINARIPHVEYARKMNSELPEPEDRREVGNVVWLEIHLEGYRGKRPFLQYGLYDPGAGDALLPGTAEVVPIPNRDEDVQTQFVPIWLGYPLSERFKAAFRLLDGNRVQAIAETDGMRSSKYRYSCA